MILDEASENLDIETQIETYSQWLTSSLCLSEKDVMWDTCGILEFLSVRGSKHACSGLLSSTKTLLVPAVGEDSLVVGQPNSGRYIRHNTELGTVVQQEDILGPSRHTLEPRVCILCRILEA